MKRAVCLAVMAMGMVLAPGFTPAGAPRMPYAAAGLTPRQAAAHLLDRFTFGARPGEVDSVLSLGLDAWLDRQLAASEADPDLDRRLAALPSLGLGTGEIALTYPNRARLLAQARRDGSIDDETRAGDRKVLNAALRDYAESKGFRPERELMEELVQEKILRAADSRNQLREVLTELWFNHFNVSTTDNQARRFIPTYEREAIRANALGPFRTLLEATARHPAMLYYLDNAQSSAPVPARKAGKAKGAGKRSGINENYARELMELHTLGVDGGYTQRDVVEVARAFTGWTVLPDGPAREKTLEAIASGSSAFVREGEFLFAGNRHDDGEKIVLGRRIPAGGGITDGERVLDIVAAHPATARHIATKLARRFVSDDPPQALVDRLAATFERTGGDIRAMVRQIAESPEFWSPEARRAKIKSPFELAISSVRALDARVVSARQLAGWIARMGEPMYAYKAPTGYPDRAEAWINSGSLLNRMNFGVALASGAVNGVQVDVSRLLGGREPESADAALETMGRMMLPERDLTEMMRQLRPVVADPAFADRIGAALPESGAGSRGGTASEGAVRPAMTRARQPDAVSFVAGVILGSPEFQRR